MRLTNRSSGKRRARLAAALVLGFAALAAGLAILPLTRGDARAQEHGEPSDMAAAAAHAHVEKQDWSFGGVFGEYDQAQLQRGFKVFQEACASCHGMRLLPFRALADSSGPGFSEAAVEQLASEWPLTISDISNEDGQPFDRQPTLTDFFPSPFPNKVAAAAANGGAAPPDFSLIAKARADHRGFPGFITDAFAGYQEAGPDYIHALLLAYSEPPADVTPVEGKYYNPIYLNGDWIAMPQPLVADEQIEYTDGTPMTVDQYARDVSAFLMWVAEPKLEARKELGFRVVIFLIVLAVLLWMTKQRIWRHIEH